MAGQDTGAPRFWIFIPGNGMWLVPAAAADPHAYARERGATRLWHGTTKNRQPVDTYELAPAA